MAVTRRESIGGPLMHGCCRVVVPVDVVAEDPVVIDQRGLNGSRSGNHHGLLDIDRLLDDHRCRRNIGWPGDGRGGSETEQRPSEAIWYSGAEPPTPIAVARPSTTLRLVIPPAAGASVGVI